MVLNKTHLVSGGRSSPGAASSGGCMSSSLGSGGPGLVGSLAGTGGSGSGPRGGSGSGPGGGSGGGPGGGSGTATSELGHWWWGLYIFMGKKYYINLIFIFNVSICL